MSSPTPSETSLHKQALVCTGTDVGTGSIREIEMKSECGGGCGKVEEQGQEGAVGENGTKKRSIRIDVISDFACPWCYIGYLDLSRGITLAQTASVPVTFSIQYHPYILNPALDQDVPVVRDEHYINKFGKEKWDGLKGLIEKRAKEEGLEFTFAGAIRSTMRAHRLMLRTYHIHGQLAHLALLYLLFCAHFEHARDIGDVEVLAEMGVKAVMVKERMEGRRNAGLVAGNDDSFEKDGSDIDPVIPTIEDINFVSPLIPSAQPFTPSTLSPTLQAIHADTLSFLRSSELEAEVKQQSAQAATKGIAGVPFSVIERRWAVSGCQKPECYFKIFEKLGSMDETALKACSALKSPPQAPAPAPAPTHNNGHGHGHHAHSHHPHHHLHATGKDQPAAPAPATAAVSS